MSYLLSTERMRCVKKNERGQVTKRVQYKKGDAVDVDMLSEGRLDALLASGALVDSDAEPGSEDANADLLRAAATGAVAGPVGAALSPSNPGEPVSDEQHEQAIADADDGDEADELELLDEYASDAESPDAYDSMTTEDLHSEVAARGLEATGSDELLKRRLRDND